MRGLLIGKGGLYGNVIRIAPPLIAQKEHVDEALEILDHARAVVHEALGGASVLRVACYVLRVACYVLRAACCVLRVAGALRNT